MDTIKQVFNVIKWVLNRLRDAEHAQLVKTLVTNLPPKLAGITELLTLINAIKAFHVREETALKRVSHATESEDIQILHKKRIDFFLSIKLTASIATKSGIASKIQAARVLKPLIKAYSNITKVSYEAATSLINNLALDLSKPQYAPSATALNLAPIVTSMLSASDELHALWITRSGEIGNEMTVGNVRQTRPAVDRAVIIFVHTLDALNYSNETVTKDPALKAKLEDAILFINSEIRTNANILAHRGIKHPHYQSFFYDEIPPLPSQEEEEEEDPHNPPPAGE